MKQLNRLIDVIQVVNLTNQDVVTRECMLIKINSPRGKKRLEILQVVRSIKEAEIVYINDKTILVEITGSERKIDSFLELIAPFGIIETVRSGIIAISRTKKIRATQIAPRKSKQKY